EVSSGCVTAALSETLASGGASLPEVLVQAEVALARVTEEGDHRRVGAELARDLQGDVHVGPRADPHEHAFATSERALRLVGVTVADRAHLVDDRGVVVAGHEARGDALDLRGAALPSRDGRAGLRLDRDDPAVRVSLPQPDERGVAQG